MMTPEQFNEYCDIALRAHRKQAFKKYIRNNWISILALVVAIIALFK